MLSSLGSFHLVASVSSPHRIIESTAQGRIGSEEREEEKERRIKAVIDLIHRKICLARPTWRLEKWPRAISIPHCVELGDNAKDDDALIEKMVSYA